MENGVEKRTPASARRRTKSRDFLDAVTREDGGHAAQSLVAALSPHLREDDEVAGTLWLKRTARQRQHEAIVTEGSLLVLTPRRLLLCVIDDAPTAASVRVESVAIDRLRAVRTHTLDGELTTLELDFAGPAFSDVHEVVNESTIRVFRWQADWSPTATDTFLRALTAVRR